MHLQQALRRHKGLAYARVTFSDNAQTFAGLDIKAAACILPESEILNGGEIGDLLGELRVNRAVFIKTTIGKV
ncbi:MAG: hypothetical protein COB16_06825 [Rhodobacteraceae bacterium]|nr:MAG: hypothetical protein COB16_06825 [Paracoccaceae bacterium]